MHLEYRGVPGGFQHISAGCFWHGAAETSQFLLTPTKLLQPKALSPERQLLADGGGARGSGDIPPGHSPSEIKNSRHILAEILVDGLQFRIGNLDDGFAPPFG